MVPQKKTNPIATKKHSPECQRPTNPLKTKKGTIDQRPNSRPLPPSAAAVRHTAHLLGHPSPKPPAQPTKSTAISSLPHQSFCLLNGLCADANANDE
ncbi:hypothetical protein niasHT_018490 [Heterodera trifolii]|uniref:Uncharacterized protein n=1 Tax=Heterodera trifolii TaxID=157864 RepID=A0ABD2KVT3_9BILA